jgi:hypothetical protein
MSWIKKLDNVLAKMGNPKAMERNHVDTVTEYKIVNARDEKIAESEIGGIWAEINEIAEFAYLDLIVVGNTKIKTGEGCEIVFKSDEKEMKLVSDMKEIESNFSNVSKIYITEISFDITDLDVDFILNREAETVTLRHKKEVELFTIVK